MRSFALTAIAAVATASNVHPYFAESNLICELCKTVVEHGSAQNWSEIDKIYQAFPALKERLSAFQSQPEMLNFAEAEESCTYMQMCEDGSFLTFMEEEAPLDLDAHIEAVNSNPKSSWVAGENAKFAGVSKREVKKLLGTVVDPEWTVKVAERQDAFLWSDSYPQNFDARSNWPECESVINHVRDQSNCGSCWAHGTTEALNDRICIATGGNFTTLLSVSDTTACCNGNQCFSFGCNGGQVGLPWGWFSRAGVVTGGDFGTSGTCYNYTMEQCAHHVESTVLPSCDDVVQVQPTCNATCPDDASRVYSDDKHFSQSSYAINGIDAIKNEIMTYGTVTSAFTVYEDFLTYKSGVYVHTSGAQLGGHAIKTIGWGVENDVPYWLCVNSWNNTWGDLGTFKIAMGDCGIDGQMHAGVPGQ